MEKDTIVIEDISSAVNYKEVMLDFEAKKGSFKTRFSHVFIRGITLINNVYIVQILWSEIPVSKSEFNINKASTNK